MRFILTVVATALLLSACALKDERPRSSEEIAAAAYRHGGQPAVSLVTVRKLPGGGSAHSGLLINASQRILYDPAGSFRHDNLVRHNDVVYGMTDKQFESYLSFHAREDYSVEIQTLDIDAATAERMMRAAMSQGRARDALCASNVSEVLSQFPQFGVKKALFPNKIASQFAANPGVRTRTIFEDSNNNRLSAPYGTPGARVLGN